METDSPYQTAASVPEGRRQSVASFLMWNLSSLRLEVYYVRVTHRRAAASLPLYHATGRHTKINCNKIIGKLVTSVAVTAWCRRETRQAYSMLPGLLRRKAHCATANQRLYRREKD